MRFLYRSKSMRVEPDRTEPFFNIPAVVLTLLATMGVLQLWRSTLTNQADFELVARFAFVPGRLTFAFDPVGVMRHVTAWNGSSDPSSRQQAALAGMFLRRGGTALWTLLTYAFLHGGWTHLGLNGLWMVAFGTPVARRFGAGRFLVFMAVAAVWGAVAHWVCYPFGFAPVIGASAAVSGMMGAAVRFMFQYERGVQDPRTVAPQPLGAVFRDRRALSFILVWFVTNSLFGAGSVSFGLTDAPVAWQAHVGGFVAGLLLFAWFDPVAPVAPSSDEAASDSTNFSVPD
ncbi:rhomboid family intramembrane serine protease [Lichenifustis flavocetrariae]|uniref:Rhomboid family intramembrane serine protease n=1 Tax=Lichenifustis flavocetrariae TaxID=2949735 RepID=A0AA41Z4J1_9HYPH|nr:rhomboid family intramembrane serine protease [Lichenifustis flavocetrariae]MCW6509117.1 rhomboid family intramembrane serine protease [Lichenifustis flavocetrariae]